MSGKTRNIAIKLVLQQCCKASCVFLARFNATFVRVGASKWHGNTVLAIQFFETLLGVRQRITKVKVRIE